MRGANVAHRACYVPCHRGMLVVYKFSTVKHCRRYCSAPSSTWTIATDGHNVSAVRRHNRRNLRWPKVSGLTHPTCIRERKGKERKGKEEYLYSAILARHTHKALRHGSHSFTCKLHHACLSFVSVHQTAPPLTEICIQLQLTTHLSIPKGRKAFPRHNTKSAFPPCFHWNFTKIFGV